MANEQAEQAEQTLATLSAQDAAAAARQPTGVPSGYEDVQFEEPTFPDEPFLLRNMRTLAEFGPFRKDEFFTDPGNGLTTAHTEDGTPVILRTISQESQNDTTVLENLADDGTTETVVVVPLRDNILFIETPEFEHDNG